ncbi:sulfotransferase domain-containing protein [Streptomyces sp. NPDC059994]|uniref:sulfotransferase domain-containing protein n=1 Tax=Streptomyces sp. NPDC059994 TaxID=3347029 RepID=UPI0036D14ED4
MRRVLEHLARESGGPRRVLLTSYERLAGDTAAELARVVEFCGLPVSAAGTLREVVEFGSFDRMRAMRSPMPSARRSCVPAVSTTPSRTRRGAGSSAATVLDQSADRLGGRSHRGAPGV